jgi:hypothetical protein
MHAMHLPSSVAVRPNLVLKTWAKQLLGSLPLDVALNGLVFVSKVTYLREATSEAPSKSY